MRRESYLDNCLLTTAQHSTLDGLGFDPLWMFKHARLGGSKGGQHWLCSGKHECGWYFDKTEGQEAVRPNTPNAGKSEKWS